jgi:hypothetical protein
MACGNCHDSTHISHTLPMVSHACLSAFCYTHFMDSTTSMQQLFEIWDTAIGKWRADGSWATHTDAAITAMSWGSYFETVYSRDPLLADIHYNFGLLEVSGPDDDPDNKLLWTTQEKLIAQAKRKYHVGLAQSMHEE